MTEVDPVDAVRVETDGPVTIVVIDRPEVRNAVDRPTGQALYDAFVAFDADEDQRVAVLTGADGTFCAGADLGALSDGRGNRVDRQAADEIVDSMGPMGPTRLDHLEAGHRRRRGSRRGRRAGARRVVRPAGGGHRCRLRRLLPTVGRPALRRRHHPPAPPHRAQPRHGPHPDRTRCRRGRSRGHRGWPTGWSSPARRSPLPSTSPTQIAAFPAALRAHGPGTRRAASGSLTEAEALAVEVELGWETIASGETAAGASRFAAGAGRHGAFD